MGKFIMSFFLIILLIIPCFAKEEGIKEEGIKIEKISYGGWDNCILMTNGTVDLIATTDVGPRIIFYGFTGKENEFFEVKDNLGKTNEPEWLPFGGHRLWIAPEEKPKTYFPDSLPIKYEIKGNTLYLKQPVESINGIEKEMEITMDNSGSHVHIAHRLTNKNKETIELAPWSITQMGTGGIAIIPQEKFIPHPDSPEGKAMKVSTTNYLPVRTLSLWSYTDMSDRRFTFTQNYILINQDVTAASPTKIGMSNKEGWAGYVRKNHLFIKLCPFKEGIYPDKGSSFESFTNQDMLELETMSPLVNLKSDQSVEHTEDWYLFDGVKIEHNDTSIDKEILTKINTIKKGE